MREKLYVSLACIVTYIYICAHTYVKCEIIDKVSFAFASLFVLTTCVLSV